MSSTPGKSSVRRSFPSTANGGGSPGGIDSLVIILTFRLSWELGSLTLPALADVTLFL